MAVWRAVVTISNAALGGMGTNTWHARTGAITGPAEDLELSALASGLNDFYTGIQALLAGDSGIHFDGTWQRAETGEDGLTAAGSIAIDPTSGGDPLPPATAIVVGWLTASGGRSGRGRTFLGPMAVETLQDNGTPTDAALATIRTNAENLVDFSQAQTGCALGVWSPQDQLLRDFIGTRTRNIFASLRSRRD